MTDDSPFDPVAEDPMDRVDLAIADVAAGRMVILVDDEDRENEGDLVFAAEKVTPELINFMAVHARGLICLSLTGAQIERLGLSMMAANNQSLYQTAFTVSIEARDGVTTGISAADRSHTVRVAIAPDATPRSVVTPGHMFPLRCRQGGVLERVGQTEGSVDLARMAGLDPSAVICEIMNPDGTMARRPELEAFGREHGIRIVSVADIIKYRMRNERVVEREHEGVLQIADLGDWRIGMWRSMTTRDAHMAVWKGDLGPDDTLVRVQTAPPPWSLFGANASTLAGPARSALQQIDQAGRGALVFMHCSNTPDGMSMQFCRDLGIEVPDAPGRANADQLRDLGTGCQILADLGLRRLRLLTSSTRPIVGIEAYGLEIVDRVPLNG
jgi:3,4-dihydroxy 2-butanone 4-phosphate synthase/GTP cyclohydrolase II